MKLSRATLPVLMLLALGACINRQEPPRTVELNRWYVMHDEEGRRAGTVLLRPVGDGEIRDANNMLIGIVTAPPK